MGLELLDLTFRLENVFGIKLKNGSLESFFTRQGIKYDLTVGDLHEWVCEELRSQGRPVPYSSWRRLKRCISEALGVHMKEFRPQSRWRQDLGAG